MVPTVLKWQILRFRKRRGSRRIVKTHRIRGSKTAFHPLIREEGGALVVRVIHGFHTGQIDLVSVAPAAAPFPDQLTFGKGAESSGDPLLAHPQLPGQRKAREDDEHLALIVDPALPAGELEAIQEKRVRHFGVQAHVGIAGVGKEPAGHLHIVDTLYVRLLHQREAGALLQLRCPHRDTSNLFPILRIGCSMLWLAVCVHSLYVLTLYHYLDRICI